MVVYKNKQSKELNKQKKKTKEPEIIEIYSNESEKDEDIDNNLNDIIKPKNTNTKILITKDRINQADERLEQIKQKLIKNNNTVDFYIP